MLNIFLYLHGSEITIVDKLAVNSWIIYTTALGCSHGCGSEGYHLYLITILVILEIQEQLPVQWINESASKKINYAHRRPVVGRQVVEEDAQLKSATKKVATMTTSRQTFEI